MKVYVARQPIFDREKNVVAYELLFRDSLENVCRHPDLDQASVRTIADSTLVFGLDTLTGEKLAFFNVTRASLLQDHVGLLPVEKAVVELLETIKPDAEVLEACRSLKQRGYQIALDDFENQPDAGPLIELADILKIDFLATDQEFQRDMVERHAGGDVRLLAEKIETNQEFLRARELGYVLFQGYFFARPEVMAQKDIPGHKVRYLQILREIHAPQLDLDHLEDILKHDVSLSYKLLRYINSAFFGLQQPIQSVRHAVVMLGEREFRKWATLVVMAGMSDDKPAELMVTAVVRARFLESLAGALSLQARSQDLFMLGLFSLLDALVDRPVVDLLANIPIADDIKGALAGEPNPMRQALELVISFERGHWREHGRIAEGLGLAEEQVNPAYFESIDWVRGGLEEIQ